MKASAFVLWIHYKTKTKPITNKKKPKTNPNNSKMHFFIENLVCVYAATALEQKK